MTKRMLKVLSKHTPTFSIENVQARDTLLVKRE